ncbi:938_t:CDS:1 [Dentiscutata heterogama]|uniref:938_t:CDS:1 n=1 Tax=Dentiscutata heterogama TaxID=1316150 RepID=A0ACA9KTS6_9GLOM|nr:938_t:CDS:1 [Dentiscutata heterogama]
MEERQSRNAGRTKRPLSDTFKEEDRIIAGLVTPENGQNDDIKKNRKKYLFIGCGLFLIIIIICCMIFYFFVEMDVVTEYDTSKIPFHYQLSLRYLYAINNRYDYIISSLPDHEFTPNINLTTRDVYQNSENNPTTKSKSTKQTELGLLISRPLRILTPGCYEVQENRYLPNNTMYRVITATARYTNWFYTVWDPPITIQFVINPNETVYNETSYQNLITCKYQFTWTSDLNGYVNRQCMNETEFLEVSYVNGSSPFGFTFYSLDELSVYAYTTAPNLVDQDFFFKRYL